MGLGDVRGRVRRRALVIGMAAAGLASQGMLGAHAQTWPPIIETDTGPVLGAGGGMADLGSTTFSVDLPLAAASHQGAPGEGARPQDVSGCNDPVCNGAPEYGQPRAWGANCNGNGKGRIEGGGATAEYVPQEPPRDFAASIFSGNGEIHGCNGHSICILTISFETKGGHATYGNASPLGTVPSWRTGTNTYGVSLEYQSDQGIKTGFTVGGSEMLYDGQVEGKLYNDGSGPSTGYVGAWEYGNNGCVTSSRSVRNAVYWTYPKSHLLPDQVRDEVRGWYKD